MPLKSPNLDDRTYKSIVEEAKRLIPAYAPEWTDWNEHDPGITLVQLFSHMTETIIYRLNRVPDKNYIEFLRLIGIELKPATPAKAHLTFKLKDNAAADTVDIPKSTPVSAEASGGGDPIVFETEESLVAVKSELKTVQSYDRFHYYDETSNNNSAGTYYYPFGNQPCKDSALYLGLSHLLPEKQISLRVELQTGNLPEEGSHCTLEESCIVPPVELIWEYWDDGWKRLDVIKDETGSFQRSGYVYFKGKTGMKKAEMGLYSGEENKLFWLRCRPGSSGFEFPPSIDMILFNTVIGSNAVTVEDEIVGSSDGSGNQNFTLEKIPVLSGTLKLEVDEGGGWEEWTAVYDLSASDRKDKHYILNRVTGEIRFGDGLNGKIPFAGTDNIRAGYRYGGGEKGNVAAGKITSLEKAINGVDEVTNKKPAYGGEDEETPEHAKKRAPQELKTRHRAVTSEDFEFLAEQTPGARIVRAKAIPLYHPEFSIDLKIPGVVTVIIVPFSNEKKPEVSEGTLKTVCNHLNKHRLLTTELYVVPPKYRKVKIKADIIARRDVDTAQVKTGVIKRIEEYYHPLTGGIQKSGWPFGGDIYFSEAYRVILDVPGVGRIEDLQIYIDEIQQDRCEDISIPGYCLVYSDEHEINVSYDRNE